MDSIDSIEYKGKQYNRLGTKWFDQENTPVKQALQKELNKVYWNSVDISSMKVDKLIKDGNSFKDTCSYDLAIKCYEEAISRRKYKVMRDILPKMASCYRECKNPGKAIELFDFSSKNYGKGVSSAAFLVSVAAAYCDVKEYNEALTCCNKAYALSGGKSDSALRRVYKRIEKETGKK